MTRLWLAVFLTPDVHTCTHVDHLPRECVVQAFADRSTTAKKSLHGILAIWVCSNIAFNYAMAIITSPGSTRCVPREVRSSAVLHHWPKVHTAHGPAARVLSSTLLEPSNVSQVSRRGIFHEPHDYLRTICAATGRGGAPTHKMVLQMRQAEATQCTPLLRLQGMHSTNGPSLPVDKQLRGLLQLPLLLPLPAVPLLRLRLVCALPSRSLLCFCLQSSMFHVFVCKRRVTWRDE